jgi:hypothetical protein
MLRRPSNNELSPFKAPGPFGWLGTGANTAAVLGRPALSTVEDRGSRTDWTRAGPACVKKPAAARPPIQWKIP